MRPIGNVLVCYRHGAMEITPQHQVAWEYRAPAQAQCHSCQPLKNGNVLVAECGMSRIVEVGKTGQIAKSLSENGEGFCLGGKGSIGSARRKQTRSGL